MIGLWSTRVYGIWAQIMEGPQKHAVLQQDLKFSKNLILRSKFERFVIVQKNPLGAPSFRNYVHFTKILKFFDTHQAHFEILRFSKIFSQKFQLKSQKIRFFAQFCVPHVRKPKFLFKTTLWYLKCQNLVWCLYAHMWHTKKNVFISEMEIFRGPSKTCGFTTGFEIFQKFDFEVKIWKLRAGSKKFFRCVELQKLRTLYENIKIFWHTPGTFWNFEVFKNF